MAWALQSNPEATDCPRYNKSKTTVYMIHVQKLWHIRFVLQHGQVNYGAEFTMANIFYRFYLVK